MFVIGLPRSKFFWTAVQRSGPQKKTPKNDFRSKYVFFLMDRSKRGRNRTTGLGMSWNFVYKGLNNAVWKFECNRSSTFWDMIISTSMVQKTAKKITQTWVWAFAVTAATPDHPESGFKWKIDPFLFRNLQKIVRFSLLRLIFWQFEIGIF